MMLQRGASKVLIVNGEEVLVITSPLDNDSHVPMKFELSLPEGRTGDISYREVSLQPTIASDLQPVI